MITIGWGDHEDTLMVFRAEAPWSHEEQIKALQTCYDMIREKSYVVDMMLDLRQMSIVSTHNMLFFNMLVMKYPMNVRAMIYIASPNFGMRLRMLGQYFKAPDLTKIFLASTVDDAYLTLERIHDT